jgi:aspartokinase-like uncharacterized kinase
VIGAVGPALVLKLGGSLAESGRLTGIIEIVARSRAPVVVVPGGGPFADCVRAAQAGLHITDRTAHRVALLAMHQMGVVIASRHPRFRPCETLADLAAALVGGAVPVWMPYALQADDDTLPNDWTTTSDALAARLAERMGGPQAGVGVALVKSCAVAPGVSLDSLASTGIADPVFAKVVVRADLAWAVYGAGDERRLAGRVASEAAA